MSSSPTTINDLAADSLSHIFAFLPPDERVRLERVCRKWQKVSKKYAWSECKTLSLDGKELAQRGRLLTLAKYRAMIDRCAPHLRALRVAGRNGYTPVQWTKMPNLRHLRIDACVESDTLREIADNLTRLQSIHFSAINWRNAAGLHDLLHVDNISLQALHLPMCKGSARLQALPSSLRLLHVNVRSSYRSATEEQRRYRIDELLELAATNCPQLAMLILPMHFELSTLSLGKLTRFKKLFFVRFNFDWSEANVQVFDNSLAKIGAQLRALMLENVEEDYLHLIAKHCPLLEHCSFRFYYTEEIFSAFQLVLQLPKLRSLSLLYDDFWYHLIVSLKILAAIYLNTKGKLEYLSVSRELQVPAYFVKYFLQVNPNLRKLTCRIEGDHTPAELDELKTMLQNMDGPLELELLGSCPRELEMGEISRVRVREDDKAKGRISQPMLRQFWAQAMDPNTVDSVPELGNLDD